MKWAAKYKEASLAISNREKKLEEVAELLEYDFRLLGSTAIEDKLQDGVGDTIKTMKKAGIKVWVLTGDKIETAINIGYSCDLLSNEMTKAIINATRSREILE